MPGADIHDLLYKFVVIFYSKFIDNDDTEVDFACMSGKFCVHVEKYLFLNPLNSFHILAVRVLEMQTVTAVRFTYPH